MTDKTTRPTSDYIFPMYMNGLHGRVLRMPANKKKKREILVIYGVHASIERMYGVAEVLSQYGTVTMPDLPGFGGMDSFYQIGEKPTLDAMADYLASFCMLRYKNRRITILGMSYGFLVVTRMLQKYPELAKKVDLLISVVGFAHKDDFKIKRRNYWTLRLVSALLMHKWPSAFVRHIILRPLPIKTMYRLVEKNHPKFMDGDREERDRRIAFEVHLWQCNDVQTYFYTGHDIFTADVTKHRVNLPVHHVAVDADRYFDNLTVEQHMRRIFTDYEQYDAKMPNHAPSTIATAKDAAPFIPPKIRQILRKDP